MAKTCACGQPRYRLGRRCGACQTAHKQARATILPPVAKAPRRVAVGRFPAHLAWIRSLPCTIAGCNGHAEAAHVRQASGGGMGLKPDDRFALPLCHRHHAYQHRVGHAAFDREYGIESRAIALQLAARGGVLLRKGT